MNDQELRQSLQKTALQYNFPSDRRLQVLDSIREAPSRGKRINAPAFILALVFVLLVTTACALILRRTASGAFGMWSYDGKALYYRSANDQTARMVKQDPYISAFATDVFPDDRGFYFHDNLLFYVTSNADQSFQWINGVGSTGGTVIMQNRLIDPALQVKSMVMSGYNAYLLADTADAAGQVIQVRLLNHYSSSDYPLELQGWKNELVSDMAICYSTLLMYSEKNEELLCVDIVTKEYDRISLTDVQDISTGYEKDGDYYAFVLTKKGLLYTVNTRTGAMTPAEPQIPKGAASLYHDPLGLHVLDEEGRSLYNLDVENQTGRKVDHQLYIGKSGLDDPRMTIAIQKFNQKYPDVEVVYGNHPGETSGLDLYMQEFSTAKSPGMLLKNGDVLELTSEPAIQAFREQYKDFWNLAEVDGRQYGVPAGIEVELWYVNQIKAQELGWEMPQGMWTWQEFEELARKVVAYNQTATEHLYLVNNTYSNYATRLYEYQHMDFLNGTADLNTEEYAYLLRLERYLEDNDLIHYETPPIAYSYSLQMDVLLLPRPVVYGNMGNHPYILPPVENVEAPAFLVKCKPLCINADTRYPEEALYFLTCYLDTETQTSIPEIVQEEGLLLRDESLYGTWQAAHKELPSERNKQFFDFVLTHGVAPDYDFDYLLWDDVHQLEILLAYNRITVEEYVQQMQVCVERFMLANADDSD